ncbi:MAG: GNAT family N-acetyltransferase [Rhodoglobus sp.]
MSEINIPRELDPLGADDFCQAVELANLSDAIAFGTHELDLFANEEIALRQPSTFDCTRMLVAKLDGRVVGCGNYDTHVGDTATTAWVSVDVRAEYQRRGIGSALLAELDAIARSDTKKQLHLYAAAPLGGAVALQPPTGYGSVPRDCAQTQFLLARGFSFEQVERVSRLALGVPNLTALGHDATVTSGDDYVVHEWIDSCPPRWREDLALLYTRMSTDVPEGELDSPEDVWTVERLLEYETRFAASTLQTLFAAVEHRASGRLVGFTSLAVAVERSRAVRQLDTIVLSEHRGHRLGMVLKLANLAHLERVAPGHPSVITYNAEENRHMLSVNEAVGFMAIGSEGAWKRLVL